MFIELTMHIDLKKTCFSSILNNQTLNIWVSMADQTKAFPGAPLPGEVLFLQFSYINSNSTSA